MTNYLVVVIQLQYWSLKLHSHSNNVKKVIHNVYKKHAELDVGSNIWLRPLPHSTDPYKKKYKVIQPCRCNCPVGMSAVSSAVTNLGFGSGPWCSVFASRSWRGWIATESRMRVWWRAEANNAAIVIPTLLVTSWWVPVKSLGGIHSWGCAVKRWDIIGSGGNINA